MKPKKDQCDAHIKFQNLTTPNAKEIARFRDHECSNERAKQTKAVDKEYCMRRNDTVLLCYDLPKVITLPMGQAGNFYYKRKFNTFNLTGHCSLNNKTYCAIWYETQAGRTGNDLASALTNILENIVSEMPPNST